MPRRTEHIDPVESLTREAEYYLNRKGEEKVIKSAIEKAKKAIMGLLPNVPMRKSGDHDQHKEIELTAVDGKSKILVRLQVAESLDTVDNICDLLREKLGKVEAEKYIIKTEYVPVDALELAIQRGEITREELEAMIVTKRRESLIVKSV